MFMRIFSVVMIPVLAITAFSALVAYVSGGLGQGALWAVLWYLVFGHIVSGLVAALVVGLPLTILAVVISVVIWALTLPLRIRLA